MDLKNVSRAMKLIFIGIIFEIISIPAFVSRLIVGFEAFSLFNIAYIIGLVLQLFAVYRLKNESNKFNSAFIITICTVLVAIIGIIFSSLGIGIVSPVFGVVGVYFVIATDILNVIIIAYIISGACEALKQNNNNELAESGRSYKGLIIGGFVISAILTFVVLLPPVSQNNVAALTLGIILVVIRAITFLVNFFFTYKTYKVLSKEKEQWTYITFMFL